MKYKHSFDKKKFTLWEIYKIIFSEKPSEILDIIEDDIDIHVIYEVEE